jgi:ligand-binding SRPBCC domain-containing protein
MTMKTFRLQSQLWLPQPRQQIFEFFADPRNLDRLTPAWLKFRIETTDTRAFRRGTNLDYRLRIHGMPIRWRSEISAWKPPELFIDRQVEGPYLLWIHQHTFVERDGGTVVGDDVEYAVPGGALVQRFLVRPDLARIFNYRHRMLEKIFNSSKINLT